MAFAFTMSDATEMVVLFFLLTFVTIIADASYPDQADAPYSFSRNEEVRLS